MREKIALHLLILSLILIIGIDITPFATQGSGALYGYLESLIDAAAVVLTYVIMRRELNFRSRVLRMAAHDLRNPLGVIRGYTELILEKSVPPEAEREMLQKIHTKSDEIIQLVNDLLDTAVLDRQQLKVEKQISSVGKLVQSVVADFEAQCQKKHQSIHTEDMGEVLVDADPARMKQVLTNLLSNASKYSPPGSEIKVSYARDKRNARIVVRDQGPGLSRAERDLIFDSFSRVKKPTTGGESSTGLGLSISKSLVELNGGKLWVESDGPGQGSAFIVELPAR